MKVHKRERMEDAMASMSVGSKRPRHVRWRKVDQPLQSDENMVDAVLEEHDSRTKRRKLTIVNDAVPPPMKSKLKGYRVLNPVQRLVDTSLKETASGNKLVKDHWNLCRTDPSLVEDRRIWMEWQNDEIGNILHVCALWNDSETVGKVLTTAKDVAKLVEAQNGEKQTPFQVAQLAGSEPVCQVLEAFGGDVVNSDDAYVFDVYRLDTMSDGDDDDGDEANDIETGDEADVESNGDRRRSNTYTCELSGGIGFWDDSGKLVFEVPSEVENTIDDMDPYDEDSDSNGEDWVGNDYPDSEDDSGLYDLHDDFRYDDD